MKAELKGKKGCSVADYGGIEKDCDNGSTFLKER